MIWAIISLVIVFGLGIILKAPEISEEEIHMKHLREQANREYLEKMDPRKFEYLIADLFNSRGYQAQVTPGSNDGGKDIILWKDDEVKFVEVKRYTKESRWLLAIPCSKPIHLPPTHFAFLEEGFFLAKL
nr:restriction endonuclease [Bacillus thuringiensis]